MAKNYLYNLLLTCANIIFPVLSFPYISRVLGPEGVGHVQFVFSFAQYFAIVAGLGIPIYGMQEIAKNRDNINGRSKAFSELMLIYVFFSLLLSLLYISVIVIFPYFKAGQDMYWIALLLVMFGCTYIDWVYTGMEQFKPIAIRSVLFKLIGLILMYTFIRSRSDYRYYLYIIMFSYLGNNWLNLILLKGKVKLVLTGLSLKRHIKPLLLIFGTTIAVIMADTDTVLLGFLANNKVVGYYAAADKLSTMCTPIVTSMSVVLMPKIAKYFADMDMSGVQNTLDQAFGFLVFLGIPVTMGVAVLAPEFISLFSGREFLPASNSLRLLSLLPLVNGFSRFFQFLVLVPAGLNGAMFKSVMAGLVASLVLNILLIPHLQQMGASVASICSELVITAIYFWIAQRYYAFTYPWVLILKALVSALVFVPIVWAFHSIALPSIVMLLAEIAACAVAYFAIQMLLFKNNLIYDFIALIKNKLQPTLANDL